MCKHLIVTFLNCLVFPKQKQKLKTKGEGGNLLLKILIKKMIFNQFQKYIVMNPTQTKDNAIFLTLKIGLSNTVRVFRPFVRPIAC